MTLWSVKERSYIARLEHLLKKANKTCKTFDRIYAQLLGSNGIKIINSTDDLESLNAKDQVLISSSEPLTSVPKVNPKS